MKLTSTDDLRNDMASRMNFNEEHKEKQDKDSGKNSFKTTQTTTPNTVLTDNKKDEESSNDYNLNSNQYHPKKEFSKMMKQINENISNRKNKDNDSNEIDDKIENLEKIDSYELTTKLFKLEVDKQTLQSKFNNINKEKIIGFTKKLLEYQERKGSYYINEHDKDYLKETKNQLNKFKKAIIDDMLQRENLIKEIISQHNKNYRGFKEEKKRNSNQNESVQMNIEDDKISEEEQSSQSKHEVKNDTTDIEKNQMQLELEENEEKNSEKDFEDNQYYTIKKEENHSIKTSSESFNGNGENHLLYIKENGNNLEENSLNNTKENINHEINIEKKIDIKENK